MIRRNGEWVDDYYMPSDAEVYQNIQRRFKDLRGYINPFLPEDNFQNMIDGFLKSLEASSLWIFDMMSTAIGNTNERKNYENSILGRKRYPIIKESFRENCAQSNPIKHVMDFPDNMVLKEQIEHVKIKVKRYKVKWDNKGETEGHFHDGGTFTAASHDHADGTYEVGTHTHSIGTFTSESHTHSTGTFVVDPHDHSTGTFTIDSHTHSTGTFVVDGHTHADGTYASESHSHGDGSFIAVSHTHSDGSFSATSHSHGDGSYYAGSHSHALSGATASASLINALGSSTPQSDWSVTTSRTTCFNVGSASSYSVMILFFGIKNDLGAQRWFEVSVYYKDQNGTWRYTTAQKTWIINSGWAYWFLPVALYPNTTHYIKVKGEAAGTVRVSLSTYGLGPHSHSVNFNSNNTQPSVSGTSSSTAPGVSGTSGSTGPDVSGTSSSTAPGVSGTSGSTGPGLGGSSAGTAPGMAGSSSSTSPGLGGSSATTEPSLSGTSATTQPGFSGNSGATQPGFSGSSLDNVAEIDRKVYEVDDGSSYTVKIELNGTLIQTTGVLGVGDSEEIDITSDVKNLANPSDFRIEVYPDDANAVIRIDTNFEAKYWFRRGESENV